MVKMVYSSILQLQIMPLSFKMKALKVYTLKRYAACKTQVASSTDSADTFYFFIIYSSGLTQVNYNF